MAGLYFSFQPIIAIAGPKDAAQAAQALLKDIEGVQCGNDVPLCSEAKAIAVGHLKEALQAAGGQMDEINNALGMSADNQNNIALLAQAQLAAESKQIAVMQVDRSFMSKKIVVVSKLQSTRPGGVPVGTEALFFGSNQLLERTQSAIVGMSNSFREAASMIAANRGVERENRLDLVALQAPPPGGKDREKDNDSGVGWGTVATAGLIAGGLAGTYFVGKGLIGEGAKKANGVVDHATDRVNGAVNNAADRAKDVVDHTTNRMREIMQDASNTGDQFINTQIAKLRLETQNLGREALSSLQAEINTAYNNLITQAARDSNTVLQNQLRQAQSAIQDFFNNLFRQIPTTAIASVPLPIRSNTAASVLANQANAAAISTSPSTPAPSTASTLAMSSASRDPNSPMAPPQVVIDFPSDPGMEANFFGLVDDKLRPLPKIATNAKAAGKSGRDLSSYCTVQGAQLLGKTVDSLNSEEQQKISQICASYGG